ncbi:GNAT family N-acetyltransferase [Nesterenkonia xinjiangensis]|uniref:Ribosomal protein S18 acetylase RimI-like enzyme n=1 Tax=Nesterenkonia xinjiangensis TaxID=225327 RepID=A0A7Z0GLW6_9MICC|nr:GNAT family N-acetyltransferase [Nesterenkonia xinjiangensis]NYJ77904.1 ribosomal protein S18 acetylase RimI-like enzyme [Nesterenkonia xinjiangensis]
MGVPDTSAEILVREVRGDDLPAFLAARPDAPSMGPYLLRQRTNGIGTGLVALDGETLVGSLELCWTWPPEVRNLHVVEARRMQGIGTALLAAAEAAVRHRGSQEGEEELVLQLHVGEGNPSARRLYERLGYRPTGQRTSTRYSSLDDDGTTRTATEIDELLVTHLGR